MEINALEYTSGRRTREERDTETFNLVTRARESAAVLLTRVGVTRQREFYKTLIARPRESRRDL